VLCSFKQHCVVGCVVDFGVSAQLDKTVGRRNTFIGTPYWSAVALHTNLLCYFIFCYSKRAIQKVFRLT